MLNTIDQIALHTNEVAILWLGQNSYILKTPQGTLFAIDPYLTRDPDYQAILQAVRAAKARQEKAGRY